MRRKLLPTIIRAIGCDKDSHVRVQYFMIYDYTNECLRRNIFLQFPSSRRDAVVRKSEKFFCVRRDDIPRQTSLYILCFRFNVEIMLRVHLQFGKRYLCTNDSNIFDIRRKKKLMANLRFVVDDRQLKSTNFNPSFILYRTAISFELPIKIEKFQFSLSHLGI